MSITIFYRTATPPTTVYNVDKVVSAGVYIVRVYNMFTDGFVQYEDVKRVHIVPEQED
jgi:hypothetical protein